MKDIEHPDRVVPVERGTRAGEAVKGAVPVRLLIMVVVFLAFVFSSEVFLKLMGVGMATAILVDATIVRMVLVPAVMQMLGRANWWVPRWLDHVLPRLDAGPAAARAALERGSS